MATGWSMGIGIPGLGANPTFHTEVGERWKPPLIQLAILCTVWARYRLRRDALPGLNCWICAIFPRIDLTSSSTSDALSNLRRLKIAALVASLQSRETLGP